MEAKFCLSKSVMGGAEAQMLDSMALCCLILLGSVMILEILSAILVKQS